MKGELTKIYFLFGANEWHGHDSESVWAEHVGDGKYKIKNSPFFAKGISFEDVVSVLEKDDMLVFEKTIISAGHSTYRILVKEQDVPIPFNIYWKPIEKLGCSFEENIEMALRMYAVDVPSTTDIYQVYSLLEAGETAGVWDFEEGHCGHVLEENTA